MRKKGHVWIVQINIPWTVVHVVNSQRIFVEKIHKQQMIFLVADLFIFKFLFIYIFWLHHERHVGTFFF